MPARHNGPVSSNVRRRLLHGLLESKTPTSLTTFALHRRYSWRSSNQALKAFFKCAPPSFALDFVRYQSYSSALHQAAAFFVPMLALVPQCLLSSNALPSLGLRLTGRSTGHFAACQVWAKIRAQTRHTAKCRLAKTLGVSNCQILCRSNTPSPQEIFGPIGRCSWRPACLRECKTSFARHQISR